MKLSQSGLKHQNLYSVVKSLLERVAPVMIDSEGIVMLLNKVQNGLEGQLDIDDVNEEEAVERGLYLLCVSNFSLCYHSYCSAQTSMKNIRIIYGI